jgi:hypothetical protein
MDQPAYLRAEVDGVPTAASAPAPPSNETTPDETSDDIKSRTHHLLLNDAGKPHAPTGG